MSEISEMLAANYAMFLQKSGRAPDALIVHTDDERRWRDDIDTFIQETSTRLTVKPNPFVPKGSLFFMLTPDLDLMFMPPEDRTQDKGIVIRDYYRCRFW